MDERHSAAAPAMVVQAWAKGTLLAAVLALGANGCCGGSAQWVGPSAGGDPNAVTVHFLLQNATSSCLDVTVQMDGQTVIDGSADGRSGNCPWAQQLDATVVRGYHDLTLSGARTASARFDLRNGLLIQIRIEANSATITSPAVPSGC